MSRTKPHNNRALAIGIAFALYGTASFAQEPQAVTELEEVTVTGSLIKGSAEDSAQAVEVVSEKELQELGRPSNVDMAKMLSEQGTAAGEANRFNAFPVGAATINLRNIGARFTTVVFNSRRFPEQYSAATGRFNNINWIPNAAVGSVEVLKQGGAVTYGADAVGGVVNYITKKNVEGFDINVDYRWIEDSDGDYTADLTWGKQFDNGNFMVVGGYQHRSTLMAIDRDWSQTGFLENKTATNWSASGSPGSYNFQRQTAPAVPPATIPTYSTITPNGTGLSLFGGDRHVSSSGFARDPSCTALGGFSGWSATPTPVCNMQTAMFENLVEEQDQYQLYMEYNLNITDSLELHTEGLYYQQDLPTLSNYPSDFLSTGGAPMISATTNQSVSPGIFGYFASGQNPAVAQYLGTYRNSDNSLVFGDPNTPGTQANAIVNGGRVGLGAGLWRPFGTGGNPATGLQDVQHNNTEMIRLTVELKGAMPEFLGTQFEWSTAATYSTVDYSVKANDMLVERMQAALNGLGGPNCTGTTPGANGCLWLNPFASAIESNVYYGHTNPGYVPSLANSPELVQWMRVPIELTREYQYVWVDLLMSGDTGIDLPGGSIAAALGGQYRYSSEEFKLDDLSNRAINPCGTVGVQTCTGTSRTGPLALGRNLNVLGISTVPPKRKYPVGAIFTEFQLPILDSVDLQLAGRYEQFYSDPTDSYSSVFVPAGAIKWQALDWLAVRVSAGETFSQANALVFESRTPTIPFQTGAATNTAYGGISGYQTASFNNTGLQPMESQYFSGGFLFQTDALTANLDFWYINIDEYTRTMTANMVLSGLMPGASSPYPAASPIDCSSPLLTQSVDALGGVPFVQLSPTAAAACAASTTGTIPLSSLTSAAGAPTPTKVNFFNVTNDTNSGSQTTTGIDISVRYRFDDVAGGTLTPSIDATRTLRWELGDFKLAGVTVLPGYDGLGYKNGSPLRNGPPVPEWRGTFNLAYSRGIHTVNMVATFVPSVTNEDASDFDASRDQNANIGVNGVTTIAGVCTNTATGLTSDLGNPPAGAGSGEFGTGSVSGTSTPAPVAAGTRGFCGTQDTRIVSGEEIHSWTNIDLTYLVYLADQVRMSFTVYNLMDEEPSFDRAGVAYNSGFGSPLERNYKLGFNVKF